MARRKAIRVALVIDQIDVRTGGTEGQILQLLERLDRSRIDPVLFCLRSTPWLESLDGKLPARVLSIRVERHPRTLSELVSFARLLRREKFDIVQTHFRDANLIGILAARLAGVPAVLSTRRGVPYWSSRPGLWFLRWQNRFVDRFVANSEATRRHYAALEGFAPERCQVIYNGLDVERFRSLDPAARQELRAALGIAQDAPIVGIVANLRPVKGLVDFLDAASILAPRFPTARFLVVGGGAQREELLQRAHRLGLQQNVTLLGSRDDVPELLQIFDIGVLTSHFESFSNSILEYVAAGLPVVVTDVGGAAEVVQDGREGFLVPPADPESLARKLGFLLSQPKGPRSWRTDVELSQSFRLDHMVRAYEDLYAGCVERAR